MTDDTKSFKMHLFVDLLPGVATPQIPGDVSLVGGVGTGTCGHCY